MVKVGIVGLGFMGGTHAQSYALLPDAEVAAVVDQDAARRSDFAAKYGAAAYATTERMLKEAGVDAVDVCLPSNLHRRVVEKAAKAGKHVLCEKPMALSLREADAMIQTCQDAGVILMVGHVLRFWPEYVRVKEIVDSGRLGAIRWMSATRLSPPPDWSWEGWLFQPKLSGGAVVDLQIHDLDTFAWLAGPPTTVSAAGRLSPAGAMDSVLTTSSGYADDVVAFAEASLAMPPNFPFTMALTVVCERGTIELNTRLDPPLSVYPVDGEPEHPVVPDVTGGAQSDEAVGNIQQLGGYFAEVRYFVECVDQGREPKTVTPEDARLALAVALAARKSAERGGRPVQV